MKQSLTSSVKNRSYWIKKALQKGIWNPNTTILMCHRVTRPGVNPWMLCVSPENFYQQMEVLKDYNLIPMQELVKNIEGRKFTRSFATSFDDGYQDNFYYGKPVLEKFELPATFFIVTQFIGQRREFWPDEREKLLLTPWKLPPLLNISIVDFHFSWDLGNDYLLTESRYNQYKEWIAWEASPTSRHALYYELSKQLRALPLCQREEFKRRIDRWPKFGI